MGGNSIIEQPDHQETNENNEGPPCKPSDFGYKKFNEKQHKEAILNARNGQDKEAKEETKRLEAELAGMGEKNTRNVLKPTELRALDESVKLKEKDKKSSPKAAEELEGRAFLKIVKTLENNNRFLVSAENQEHLFEFKGLTKKGKEVKPQEAEKILEHMDRGGDVPQDIELKFQTSFKKNREKDEAMGVSYTLNIHQIMIGGLEATLSSLLSLSYAAAANYDAVKGRLKPRKGAVESEKKQTENFPGKPLEDMKTELQKAHLRVATIQTDEWNGLEVSLPERQKQFVVVYDGAVFQLTEKRFDKKVEIPAKTPAEILQYIAEASEK